MWIYIDHKYIEILLPSRCLLFDNHDIILNLCSNISCWIFLKVQEDLH